MILPTKERGSLKIGWRFENGEWILLSFVKNNSVWFNIAGEQKKRGKLVLWDDRNDNSWFRFQRIYGDFRGCGGERGGDFPEGYEKVNELGKGGQGAAYLCNKILWTGTISPLYLFLSFFCCVFHTNPFLFVFFFVVFLTPLIWWRSLCRGSRDSLDERVMTNGKR